MLIIKNLLQAKVLALGLFFCATAMTAAEDGSQQTCASSGGLNFICDIGIPEDLVLVPGTPWVVASSYSGLTPVSEKNAGAVLYLIDSRTKEVSPFYSIEQRKNRFNRNIYGACPGAPEIEVMYTHGLGIQTQTNDDGIYTLYAVSHGGREAIEVFELDASSTQPQLTWTGCVLMPEGLDANDVSSMRDGTILATVLMHPGDSFEELLAGQPTGAVYKWTPGSDGFVKLEGSELPGNNGIQVSEDEREIFVASSGLRAIFAIENNNPSKVLRRSRTLGFAPDNVVYGTDGYLLTAGMRDDEPSCEGTGLPPVSGCPRGSMAVSIHPTTMQDQLILDSVITSSFSGATMAILPGGKEIWVGSFTTPRIMYQLINK